MKHIKSCILILSFFGLLLSCKKEQEINTPIPDAVYITSTALTGSGAGASTTITNTASGKISISPASARVYLNTPKTTDISVGYTLGGTAIAGTNYVLPPVQSIVIPAGKWYADINISVINTPLPSNRTIIINLSSSSNNLQLGLGSDKTYKSFSYTLTN